MKFPALKYSWNSGHGCTESCYLQFAFFWELWSWDVYREITDTGVLRCRPVKEGFEKTELVMTWLSLFLEPVQPSPLSSRFDPSKHWRQLSYVIEGIQRPTQGTLDAIMHEITSKRIWMPKLVLYSIATLTLMIIIQPIKANIVGSRPIRVEKHALIFALPGQRENKSLEQL